MDHSGTFVGVIGPFTAFVAAQLPFELLGF